MGTSLERLLEDPVPHLAELVDGIFGINVDRTLIPRFGGLVVELTFAPPSELIVAGYHPERARISVRRQGEPLTFPLGPRREWKHRYPFAATWTPEYCFGQLCLWFPQDPRPLKWLWEDGFEDYVSRVHRHLFLEEYWRRTGVWPTEDAPHGFPDQFGILDPLGHATYPIKSHVLRNALGALANAWTTRRKAA